MGKGGGGGGGGWGAGELETSTNSSLFPKFSQMLQDLIVFLASHKFFLFPK